MTVISNVVAVGQVALQYLSRNRKRGFDDGSGTFIIPDATIEEVHTDDMEITDHPVEQGATISDHAFKRHAEVIVTAGWSDSPNNSGLSTQLVGFAANSNSAVRAVIGAAEFAASAVGTIANIVNGTGAGSPSSAAYAELVSMQSNRTLFTIYTGKRMYQNMLIKSLATTTDQKTENSAVIRISFRQILMAQTQTVTVPDSSVMDNPQQNGATVNNGTQSLLPSPTYNANALPKFNSSGQQL
ncbi:hypothetical protein NDK50_07885 [Paraburkholderia bryophila]|uniref:phage baseplate protein n=1 Tax=Paraburkholderia bryophila TaxID=420952 RepID=UPI00234B4D2F|nr:hypothetical protein [Paraburkholderia bryophila]WCM21356.1 hypothetical protein NDK50_07885 [Paraburkholderia bryophila]